MKYFFMSCCGVTVTARRARSSSSSSTVSSVREGRRTTTRSPARVSPTPRTTISQTTSQRGPRSTAMSQARVSPTPRTVRQTSRSEVEMSQQQQQLPRRKHGRSGSSVVSAPSYSEWKPSLSSIAEDNSFISGARKAVGNRTAGDERAVQRKEGGDWSRVHVRKYSADYGRASVATSIPAFNPTPFMF